MTFMQSSNLYFNYNNDDHGRALPECVSHSHFIHITSHSRVAIPIPILVANTTHFYSHPHRIFKFNSRCLSRKFPQLITYNSFRHTTAWSCRNKVVRLVGIARTRLPVVPKLVRWRWKNWNAGNVASHCMQFQKLRVMVWWKLPCRRPWPARHSQSVHYTVDRWRHQHHTVPHSSRSLSSSISKYVSKYDYIIVRTKSQLA